MPEHMSRADLVHAARLEGRTVPGRLNVVRCPTGPNAHTHIPPATLENGCGKIAELHGTHLGPFPVRSPDDAVELGVEAVILSSDTQESAMWERRDRYERNGIEVRRLYGPQSAPAEPVCLT
ncbi:MAG: hypothetical protein IH986_18095 [Planctomycetes bacterium]|nr:hypothetical protein [Planctomycetota bacterium]